MRYVSPIRGANLRERARTVREVAAAAFMVIMSVAAVAFTSFMIDIARWFK